MKLLDDPKRLREGDPSGMSRHIEGLPQQLEEALTIGRDARLALGGDGLSSITVCGMGGSAIGGELGFLVRLEMRGCVRGFGQMMAKLMPGMPARTYPDGKDLPVVRAWVAAADAPLFSTSANRAGEEPARDSAALSAAFGSDLDLLVEGPTFPAGGPPSTIVDASEDPPRLVRAGAVPFP